MDRCGPEGGSVIQKAISFCIPDKVLGVDISSCCANHDAAWNDGPDLGDDIAFRNEIIDRFYIHGKPDWQGKTVAWLYFIGVRVGSIFYKLEIWLSKHLQT